MKIMVLDESKMDEYGYDLMESAKELKNQLVRAINKNPDGEVILKIIQDLEREFNDSQKNNDKEEQENLLKVAKYYVNWLKKSEKITDKVGKEIKQFETILNQIEMQLNKSSMSDASKRTIMDYYYKKIIGYISELKKTLNKNKEILKSKDMMQQYTDKRSTEDANNVKKILNQIKDIESSFKSRFSVDLQGAITTFIEDCFKESRKELVIPEMKSTGKLTDMNNENKIIIKFDKNKNILQKSWLKASSNFNKFAKSFEYNNSKSSSNLKVFDNVLTPFASDEEVDAIKIQLVINFKDAIITLRNVLRK